MKALSILFALIIPVFGCASVDNSQYRDCSPVTIQHGHDDFNVNVSVYAEEKKSSKSLLIMPPTGGTNYIDRSYAEAFCKKGYDVYILNSWTNLAEPGNSDIELHQRLYKRGQRAVSLVLAEIKSPFIGMLGTSLGALHAGVSANLQTRLNAIFLIVGGAPIREIIVDSDHPDMRKLFEARKQRYAFKNASENLAALEKAFSLEPMSLGDGYKTKSYGTALGLDDSTVPTANQIRLSDFFKPQTLITYSSSHFFTILKTWLFSTDEIIEFFEKSAQTQRSSN